MHDIFACMRVRIKLDDINWQVLKIMNHNNKGMMMMMMIYDDEDDDIYIYDPCSCKKVIVQIILTCNNLGRTNTQIMLSNLT